MVIRGFILTPLFWGSESSVYHLCFDYQIPRPAGERSKIAEDLWDDEEEIADGMAEEELREL